MDEHKGSGIGFLKASRARHAEEAIGHSEGLVTVLKLTQVDLKPAEDALRIAKDLFATHDYAKALRAAQKAESLAITLDERYSGYQKAEKILQSRIGEMSRLGLRTEDLEALIGRAGEKVLSGIWENGAFVPNYLEARVLLERAEQEGRTLQDKAERASNSIFLAELGIEALVETKGPAEPRAFAQGAAWGLEEHLQDATKELALGNAEGATLIAQDIERKATRLRMSYVEGTKVLDDADVRLGDMRAEGILTERIESQIKNARDMLATGIIEPGAQMAKRLADETKTLAETYEKARTGLADADVLYARLTREGFHSYDADAAIRDTRTAMREGNYARAVEHLERAHQAFARRTNAREALAKALEETRTRMQMLQGAGVSFLPDIQEVLDRAGREFHNGNYSGSSEDLRIATVLLDQMTRAPSPKP
ncbi:MAG TPA: hypothetical protein VIL45_02015 [Thermoplasmata archaeon]